MKDLLKIYKYLLRLYGPQGWWPLYACINTKKGGTAYAKGYHPGDYSYPKHDRQRFEICAGSILTQNTAWTNVEKALLNLKNKNFLSAQAVKTVQLEDLKEAIKPAGYFNQKSVYLREIAEFYLSVKRGVPSRKELLSVKGVGPETADSILLYAYNQPEFVVDAYTRRIFSAHGFFNEAAKYNEIKDIFESSLPKDIVIYQEYHALIVLHSKNNYSKNNLSKI